MKVQFNFEIDFVKLTKFHATNIVIYFNNTNILFIFATMNGIIILALKNQSYYQGAANLALSIKHYSPKMNITLVSDMGHLKCFRPEHYASFDWIKEIKEEDFNDENGFSPALAKINIHKYSTYDNTLYIDADSLVLQDIQPLMDKLISLKGNFYSNVLGEGGFNDDITYQAWATNEKLWDYFNLKKEDIVYTFNTSWFFFTKNSKKIFNKVLKNYHGGFKKEDLKNKWGSSLPDELFFYGTLAQMKINPKVDFDVCFFGDKIDSRTLTELQNDYYMFTLYGGRTTVRLNYREWYDRLVNSIWRKLGYNHLFKAHGIMQGKHVHTK